MEPESETCAESVDQDRAEGQNQDQDVPQRHYPDLTVM